MDVASAHVMVGADADAHGVLDQARGAPARARDRARHHPGGARRPRRVRRAQLVTGWSGVAGRVGAPARLAGVDGRRRNAAATASPPPSPSVSITSRRANPAENVLGHLRVAEAGDVGQAAGDEQEDGGDEHDRHRRLRALAPDPSQREQPERDAGERVGALAQLGAERRGRRVPQPDHVHDLGERRAAPAPPRTPCATRWCATARTRARRASTAPITHGHGDGGGTYTICPRTRRRPRCRRASGSRSCRRRAACRDRARPPVGRRRP